MSEDQKKRKILAAIAAASMLTGAAPAIGSPPGRVEIEHKGRDITVSCNALDGHARHADAAEMESLEAADRDCKKQAEQRTKQESEQKKKHGATGFADAEHDANRQAAAELVQLLGDD